MKDLDPNSTPDQIINKLLNEAAESKNLRPVTQAIDFLEKLLSGLSNQLQYLADSLTRIASTNQIRIQRNTLTLTLLVKMLEEKKILTEAEFKERYEVDVVQVMEKGFEEMKKKQEEKMKEMQDKYEEMQKEAEQAEEGQNTVEEEPKEVDTSSDIKEAEEENEYDGDVILASERFKKD